MWVPCGSSTNDMYWSCSAGRMTRKQRKGTLAEELLADEELTRMRKKRYSALQEEASRWSHKKVKKTNNPRIKKRAKKPKH
jgi:hypothetical protein